MAEYRIVIDADRMQKERPAYLTAQENNALCLALVKLRYSFIVDPPTVFQLITSHHMDVLERRVGLPLKSVQV